MRLHGLALCLVAGLALLSACGGSDTDTEPIVTPEGMSCTSVTDAGSCTNGAIAEIYLGPMTSAECHSQCESEMEAAGLTSGCWVLANNTHCYCRSGVLATGGDWAGGTCTNLNP